MKVKKYKTFWAFLILFVVTLGGINYAVYTLDTKVHTASQGQINIDLFTFPQVWSTTAWCSSFSVLLLGLLVIVLLTNEYTFKTHRQQIIDGLSRKQFMTGKWLTIGILIIFTWLLYFIITLLIGDRANQASVFDGFYYAGYFLIKVVLSISVAFMFALLFKRSGLAIALYLAYALILEGIIGHLFNNIIDGLGYFLPLASGGYLVSNPFRQIMPGMESVHIQTGWILLTCFCYIILFIGISYRYIQRADL